MIDGNWNTKPKGWEKITEKTFSKIFFISCLKKAEFRQIKENGHFIDTRLFEFDYESGENLGIAMCRSDNGINYYRFGDIDKWQMFNLSFANQFAGDNS